MGIPRDPRRDAGLGVTVTASTVWEILNANGIGFSTVRDRLEVSDSVLSKHVGTLASLGYVRSRKGVHGGRRTTWISLAAQGRAALGAYVAALREVIAGVE